MKQLGSSWLALVVVLGGFGRSQAQPTFVETRLKLRAEAAVAPDPVQWKVVERFLTGSYLDFEDSVATSSSTDNGTITALASASVTWESTSRGRVTFTDTGFLWAVFQQNATANLNDSAWSYTFTTQTEDFFILDYAAGIGESSSKVEGIGGFQLVVSWNGLTIFSRDMPLETSDTIWVPLRAGQTYTVAIIPQGEIFTGKDLGISTMWGDFQWEIVDF